MDASFVTNRNRNQMIFAWYSDQQVLGKKLLTATSYDVQIERTLGGDPSLERQVPVKVSNGFTLEKMILTSLDSVLEYAAARNLGPTRSSRFFYIWFFSVTSAYNWICPSSRISGIKDSWNWSTHYPLYASDEVFIWMTAALMEIMPKFVPDFPVTSLMQNLLAGLAWDSDQETVERVRIQQSCKFGEWKDTWIVWFDARKNDGNVAAAAVPPDSSLPNGSQTLEVTTTTDNPNDFTNPQKWVPLKINGSKKNYLTFGWGDVTSTGITSSQQTDILETAQNYFPGTASTYNDGSSRSTEIAEVVTITGSLTDSQKMIAEFWAGGPFTVSPPGMFIFFWRWFMDCYYNTSSMGCPNFFFSGLDLAIHLFETGRIVWQSKKDNFQARPIQEIRRMYRGQTLTKWDGSSVLGEAWTPYQETNFVTPPFPDFPSGHSAFSQSFAKVMNAWFGSSIPTNSVTITNLNLISPIFSAVQSTSFGTFKIPEKSSQIQTSVVPSSELTFSYPTWQAMADEAGISRKYGGIHATSAHTGSQALANELHTVLSSTWNISTS